MSSRRAGFSLIEVIVFIIVLAIAFVGLVLLYNRVTQASVDPLIRKQALAIAASLLEEIELQAYTLCDPDDPAVFTATVLGDCATGEGIGTEGGETRYGGATPRFDNVSDYDGFAMGSGVPNPNHQIMTVNGAVIDALANYRVNVVVASINANELGATIPDTVALRITVTATHVPTGLTVSLQGYRTRYAPNSL